MARLTPHPWREVEYISDRIGPRGARYWWLTLSCGHRAGRPMPVINRQRILHPAPLAPKRVRCIHCPVEREPR